MSLVNFIKLCGLAMSLSKVGGKVFVFNMSVTIVKLVVNNGPQHKIYGVSSDRVPFPLLPPLKFSIQPSSDQFGLGDNYLELTPSTASKTNIVTVKIPDCISTTDDLQLYTTVASRNIIDWVFLVNGSPFDGYFSQNPMQRSPYNHGFEI